jgi:hypothetical protein
MNIITTEPSMLLNTYTALETMEFTSGGLVRTMTSKKACFRQ